MLATSPVHHHEVTSKSPKAAKASKSAASTAPPKVIISPVDDSGATATKSMANPADMITYVFPDFGAVRYFQRDFVAQGEFHIMEETVESGFDIYLVEQWVNNRTIGSILATYTGNSRSKVMLMKFTVKKKPSRYYPRRFQEYLNELMVNHAKVKVIDKHHHREILFVTNLTTLPSNLNLIPIPSGDLRAIYDDYIVNSNLKKLHCSGRSLSLITEKISVACEDKFRQMYKVYNVKVPVKFAIKEMVNLIQTCLFYFDLLDAKYCDGFLCSKTEEAISQWWDYIGLPHFGTKPNTKAGVLSARTVAAIISFIISVKYRLQLVGGCDSPKDPFDYENFMISIGQFQRQYKLEKRRKLDLDTLNKLFTITNGVEKSANMPMYNDDILALNNNFEPNSTSRSAGLPMTLNGINNSSPQLGSVTSYNQLNSGSGGLSSYRKNKNYYSKEIKKLTNVVRTTVQDHIGAVNRSGEDGRYYENHNGTKSSGTRRIKKLSELDPNEIETLDLELLVKNYLVGKRLDRLWYGAQSSIGDPKKDASNGHSTFYISNGGGNNATLRTHHHHASHNHGHHDSSHLLMQNSYKFVSLRDEIAQIPSTLRSNGSKSEFSRYSRGLTKMKMGLQGRKGAQLKRSIMQDTAHSSDSSSKGDAEEFLVDKSTNLIDTLLGVGAEDAPDEDKLRLNENQCPNKSEKSEPERFERYSSSLETFNRGLNRRNSYPFVPQVGEVNLNTVEFVRNKDDATRVSYLQNGGDLLSFGKGADNELLTPWQRARATHRSSSFSIVDDYFLSTKLQSPMQTIEKLSANYLRSVSNLQMLHKHKQLANSCGPDEMDQSDPANDNLIESAYAHLNRELIKLDGVNAKMQHNKYKIIDQDLVGNLEFKIGDLRSNIDRLVYETRIVVKRINELEENSQSFDDYLEKKCNQKLLSMMDTLVVLRRFNDTFSDPKERQEVIMRLTGKDSPETAPTRTLDSPTFECDGIFQFFTICLYEIVYALFQVVKFDRSKLNLDRIRGAWAKLDPNRKYIERAYTFVGRNPVQAGETS